MLLLRQIDNVHALPAVHHPKHCRRPFPTKRNLTLAWIRRPSLENPRPSG